ncbi:MAG: hypothetical protein PUP90_08780 [Nostoc sp. S4]|nr:hypothetical protein [Nostoc sp. S4]
MSAIQLSVHPSTVLVAAPLYKLGQRIYWIQESENFTLHFSGIITEQVYRIDHNGGHWEFTASNTIAKNKGKIAPSFCGEDCYDLIEVMISDRPLAEM